MRTDFDNLKDFMSAVAWEIVKREERGDWTRVTYKASKSKVVVRVVPIFAEASGSAEFHFKPAGKGLAELRRVCGKSTSSKRKVRNSSKHRKVAGKDRHPHSNKRVGKAVQR